MPYVKAAEYARLQAADDFTWMFVLAINLGLINRVPLRERKLLFDGGLGEWVKRSVQQGLLKEENDA